MTKIVLTAYCRTPGHPTLSTWVTDEMVMDADPLGQVGFYLDAAEREARQQFRETFQGPVLMSVRTTDPIPVVSPRPSPTTNPTPPQPPTHTPSPGATHRTEPSRA